MHVLSGNGKTGNAEGVRDQPMQHRVVSSFFLPSISCVFSHCCPLTVARAGGVIVGVDTSRMDLGR